MPKPVGSGKIYLTTWLTIISFARILNHMVKYAEDRLSSIFQALSDPTRRAMLARLAQQELTVTALAAPYDMSLAAVSKHLKVLEGADIVKKVREGRTFRCRADLAPLAEVTKLLDQLGAFWRTNLEALEDFLSEKKTSEGEKHGKLPRK